MAPIVVEINRIGKRNETQHKANSFSVSFLSLAEPEFFNPKKL